MASSENDLGLEKRIIALEEGVMHSEGLLASLNEVMCDIQRRLDEQGRQLAGMKKTVEAQKTQEMDERSFEDERPPHY